MPAEALPSFSEVLNAFRNRERDGEQHSRVRDRDDCDWYLFHLMIMLFYEKFLALMI